jgi:coenzyme F420-reducing hydrogenase delta subunit
MAEQTKDLNDVITSAVQARVEAEVAAALSGTDVVKEMVVGILQRKIEVKDGGGYRTRETTVIAEMIDKAMLTATREAIGRVIAEEADAIEAAVAAELRRNVKAVARTLAGQLQETARSSHGLSVELKYPGRY